MVARKTPEPGVYRFIGLLDGRPAFYTIDYHGQRSVERIVGEDESEAEVIADLSDALWALRPRESRPGGGAVRAPRPVLRLL